MNSAEVAQAFKLLFENFWIVRSKDPENYMFLRRYQTFLQKEIRDRFGMKLIVRNNYIQLLKRPPVLHSWMGENGFVSQLDYTLFCFSMAYIEGMDADKAFMLDELIREIELMKSEHIYIDWTNFNHRKSLVRVVQKMLDYGVIETIQGETEEFGKSEHNQEVLFITTSLARSFLSRAPKFYTKYETFEDYWLDFKENQHLEINQLLYQQLMMTPLIKRTSENEELFSRLKNYYHHMNPYFVENTLYNFELYRDYAALAIEQRENGQDIFPSRKVVDEILIQLATLCRELTNEKTSYGLMVLSLDDWQKLLVQLKENYGIYWSKEFSEMSIENLGRELLNRGKKWELFTEEDNEIVVYPVFSRLVAEMRDEDE